MKENSFDKSPKPDNGQGGKEKNPLEDQESSVEREIDQEILILENNVAGLQEDIENFGGEEKLQEELERNDLLASRWTDRLRRVHAGISGLVLTAATGGLVWATEVSHLFEKIVWDIPDDAKIGAVVIGTMVVGATIALQQIGDFMRYQKRVSRADDILENI